MLKKVFLATNNEGKVERFSKLIRQVDPSLEIFTPESLGIEAIDVEETGSTLRENAEIKARAYLGKVDMPILANDTGYWIEGEGLVSTPKRTALGETQENSLTKEQTAEKLLEFWKSYARKHGGQVNAAWQEVFVCVLQDGSLKSAESKREVVMMDKEFGKAHIQMPVRALYISKATGKPALEHTEEEEILEMQPVISALKEVLGY